MEVALSSRLELMESLASGELQELGRLFSLLPEWCSMDEEEEVVDKGRSGSDFISLDSLDLVATLIGRDG